MSLETRMTELVSAIGADIKALTSGKAPLNSPALTGTPTAPTPTAGDASTQIATTAFVATALGDVASALDIINGV